MPLYQTVLNKYVTEVFVETGSYIGDGIQSALDCDFNEVHSIELAELYYNACRTRFSGNSKVKLYLGDSALILKDVLSYLSNKKLTLWLDGHPNGNDTLMGIKKFPLIEELRAISKHDIKSHIIMIDDIRLFQDKTYGFDVNDLKNEILKINKDYKFQLEYGFVADDILVAYI